MIEPRRLARALALDAERLPDGRFLVTGGSEPRLVDLADATPCGCPDATMRGVTRCKHVLRAELGVLPDDLIHALRELVGVGSVRLLPVTRRRGAVAEAC
jgi:hypothetical protein